MRTTIIRHFIILFFLLFHGLWIKAQIQVTPANPTVSDSITLLFDATKGNAGLANCNCNVYMHTGVITTNSTHPGDWKYVKAGWGSTDSSILMQSLGNNLYQASFRIDSFYGVPSTDTVVQLAFIFRNANGNLSGRSASNGDIFYSINLQSPNQIVNANVFSNGNEVIMETNRGYVSFRAFTDEIIRFKYQQNSIPETDSSLMLVDFNPSHSLSVQQFNNMSVLDAGNLKAIIQHNPFKVAYVQGADTLVKEQRPVYNQFGRAGCFLSMESNEEINGTGFRAIDLDLNGQQLEFYNQAHYGYSRGARNANTSIPFYTSSKGYGIYFNNHLRSTINFGGSSPNTVEYEVEGNEINYFVIGGGNYDQVLKNYQDITGYHPLPPLWSLGYIQSKYGYETETEARQVVSRLKQNNYPIDALILDLYWFGSPATMGNLDWDRTRFPNAEDMMDDFEADGVKTILITETYFTQQSTNFNHAAQNNYLATTSSGAPFIIGGFWAGSSGLLDVSNPDAMNWFWSKYKPHIDAGVAGWWCDLGEPENHPFEMQHAIGSAKDVHNTYSLEWAKLLYEKYKSEYPSQRLFNLIRSGYSGMQRYSTYPWSGDIQRSWDGLKIQVPIMLNMSMSGVAYMHSDLGGFVGGGQNDELYTRWMQLGTFSPIMRAHGTGMPTEPYNFGSAVQPHLRKALRLRYELLPYTYHLAFENTQTGRPIAKPMHYFEPDNTLLQDAQYQYYWGSDLIVAPVLDAGKFNQNIVLPTGKWFDYETGVSYNGNQTINMNAPISKIPVVVKAGSLIATTTGLNNTAGYVADALIVKFYKDVDVTTSFNEYYVDNGTSPQSFANGQYEMLKFNSEVFSANNLDLICLQNGPGFTEAPLSRKMQFEIFNYVSAPTSVAIGQRVIGVSSSKNDYDTKDTAAYFDNTLNRLWVKFNWEMNPTRIQIRDTAITNPLPNPTAVAQTDAIAISEPYPNPFSDAVFIELDFHQEGELQIEVTTISGQLVYQTRLNGNGNRTIFKWDGKSNAGQPLPSGVYLLKTFDGKASRVSKLLKR